MTRRTERPEGCTCTITAKERMGAANCPVHSPDQDLARIERSERKCEHDGAARDTGQRTYAECAPDLRPGFAPHTQGASYTEDGRTEGSLEPGEYLHLTLPGQDQPRWYRIRSRVVGGLILVDWQTAEDHLVSREYIAKHITGLSIHRDAKGTPVAGRQGPVRGPCRGPACEALDGPPPDTLRGAG